MALGSTTGPLLCCSQVWITRPQNKRAKGKYKGLHNENWFFGGPIIRNPPQKITKKVIVEAPFLLLRLDPETAASSYERGPSALSKGVCPGG